MSYVTIDYKSLEDASDEAKAVSKKLEDYAETLHRKVYKKLEEYSGTNTDNIWIAKNNINTKISNLYSRSRAYATYTKDLEDLKSQCESVDRAVKTKVSKLSAEFKQSHGIKNSVLENTVNYHLISFKNTTSAGRWISDKADVADSFLDYIAESVEDWWDYEGGEEYAKGFANATLETVLAVCAVAGAIVSGAALAVTVASITAACIAVADALISMYHEVGAYNLVQYDDPATAKRRQEIDSLEEHLTSSFMYGGDGEAYEFNQTYQYLAVCISVVETTCEVIGFVSALPEEAKKLGDLAREGYKWSTGSLNNLDDIRPKDVFAKETWQALHSKIATKLSDGYSTAKTGFDDIYTAVRTGGIKNAKNTFSSDSWKQINGFLSASGRNIKENFIEQCKGYTLSDVREAEGIQNRIEAEKDFIEKYVGLTETVKDNGFSLDTIKDIGWNEFIKPSIVDGMTNTIFNDKKKTHKIEEVLPPQERAKEEVENVNTDEAEANFMAGFRAGLEMGIASGLQNNQNRGIDVDENSQLEVDRLGESEGSSFVYKSNPMDNPKAARDIVENKKAVYGFSPNPESVRIGKYANKIDWANSEQVAIARQARKAYHDANELMLKNLYNEGYTTKDIAAKMVEERNSNRINSYIKNGDLEGLAIVK